MTNSLLGRSLLLAAGAFAMTAAFTSSDAEAGRFRFGGHASVRFGGGVRVSGPSVHVSYARPAWRPHRTWAVSGHIYIGPTYSYRPYYYYQPEYVPSYYGSSYYPVQPAPVASAQTVYVAPEPELPRLGVGLFAGGAQVEDRDESSDIGVLGRFRLSGGLLVEGEVGKTSYADNLRVDRRLGASLIYEIGARNRFAPYVLAGMGMQQSETAGTYNADQSFAEIGAGIRYAVTPHFHLTADIRLGARETMASDDMTVLGGTTAQARVIAPPTSDANDTGEQYTRGRLSALYYF